MNAIDAPAAGIVVVPSVTVAVTVKSCCVPTGLLIDGEIVTVYATHVFEAVAGALNGMSVTGTPPTVVAAIAVTVSSSVPGPASCTMQLAGSTAGPRRRSDTTTPDRASPNPRCHGQRRAVRHRRPVSLGRVGHLGVLHRRRERVRHPHQVRGVRTQQHPVLRPRLRRRQRHRLAGCLTRRARKTVRSTTRPALSVRLVTVNVPDPAAGDVTVTVHVPTALVVHGLGVTSDPAPDHVNAIDAPAAGVVVVPSVTVAVIVKSCGTPTGLVADGDTVTVYASHVFDAVAGALNAMSVNVTALTVVDAIAVTVRVERARPRVVHDELAQSRRVVPVVRHDDAGSSVPGPGVDAVNVVPSDTGAPVGLASGSPRPSAARSP